LSNRRFAVLVNGRDRQDLGPQHEQHHRLIARIDLLVGWRHRHLRRELTRRLRDHRLDVLRRRVDVPAQIELQRDVRAPLRARRVDRVEARYRGKLLFERQRHGRRHRFRARAGKTSVDLNRGKVNRRQVADRQEPIRHHAEYQDPQHDERRGNRSFDEECREVHDAAL